MVGGVVNMRVDEDTPHNNLYVGEHKDKEDEPLEIQLSVGKDAEWVANSKWDVPDYSDYPICEAWNFWAEELEDCLGVVGGQNADFRDVQSC